MATANPEQDVLPRGISVDAQTLGPWLANVYERKQALEVRPGFGQQWQADSTLTLRDPGLTGGVRGAVVFGYTKVLGSKVLRTSFGHTQICTTLAAIGYTGDGWNGALATRDQVISSGQAQTFVVLSVHDLTANETQEFVLHRHTAENSEQASSPQDWRGLWSSYNNKDYGAVYKGASVRTWFCEYRDILLFGAPEIGTWAYRPVDLSGLRRQWVETHKDEQNVTGYSESCAVWPVVASDGAFSEKYPYLPPTAWPVVVDATVIGNRVVYASTTDLYFSDPGNPSAIMAQNIVPSSSDRPITAVAAVLGQLVYWTASETFTFQPDDKAIVSGGRRIKVSEAIGCLGAQAKVRADAMLTWVDDNGVWQTKGDFNIVELSVGIEQLFVDQLQNPLSYWFQTQLGGYSPSNSPHVPNVIDWRDTADVNLAYDQIHDLLFVCVPAYNVSLVHQDGGWKIWSWDTLVTATARETTLTRNVSVQSLNAFDGEVYLTHGIDVLTPTDAARSGGGAALSENQPYGSYALLTWRRGGALDRSVEATEDGRLGGGWYTADSYVTTNDGAVYLGEPVAVPAGYILPHGTMPAGGLLYPVMLRCCSNATVAPPDTVRIVFNFDNTNWAPATFGGGATQIDVLFPAPRQASRIGWGYTAPVAAIREIQLYGNQIRAFFFGADGAIPVGTWSTQPQLNITPFADSVLFWVPFKPTTASTTMSLGVQFPVAPSQTISPAAAKTLTAFWYEQPWQLPLQTSDAVVQAVDWAVKTAQLGLEHATQTRARGLFVRAQSRGAASTPIATWLYAQLNAWAVSDWKDWSAQIVDFPVNEPSEENSDQARLPGLRARMYDAIGDVMAARTFGNKATWGDAGTAATGNFLVDDPQVDTLAVSSGVKGEHVSWLLFGNMLNRAEALAISSVKAVLQARGQRRRTGRQ